MKKYIISFVALLSSVAMANEIQGTLMLKGSLKTKIVVNGVNTTCKLKVEKVRNILAEDNWGNPGYQARIELSLDGNDFERGIRVKLNKQTTIHNMHTIDGVKTVKDLDYINQAENIQVLINKEGRLVSTTFPYQNQIITCKF